MDAPASWRTVTERFSPLEGHKDQSGKPLTFLQDNSLINELHFKVCAEAAWNQWQVRTPQSPPEQTNTIKQVHFLLQNTGTCTAESQTWLQERQNSNVEKQWNSELNKDWGNSSIFHRLIHQAEHAKCLTTTPYFLWVAFGYSNHNSTGLKTALQHPQLK